MKTNSKIAAYTLSETLMVLVITAISVAIGFSVLKLVTKQVNAIKSKYEESTTIAMFKQRLLSDFDTYEYIEWKDGLMEIELTGRDTLLYQFDSAFVLRNSDTVSISVKEIIPFYLGKEISSGTIDALLIDITDKSGSEKQLFVSQRYSADNEMNVIWD